MRYRWHAYFDRDLAVLYRETRRGEIVYVCVMPDGTGSVVPEWMFDSAVCTQSEIGAARLSVDAMLDLRALLAAIGSDSVPSSVFGPTEEDRRGCKTRFEADEHIRATTAGADEPRRGARRVEAKRDRRTTRKAADASRASAPKPGADR